MSKRSYELARRLELGALALEAFASSLTEFEWQSRLPGDGRKIGVVVHHVASVYPIEIQLAQTVAKGQAVEGLTWDVINKMNAASREEIRRRHERRDDRVTEREQRGSRSRDQRTYRRRTRSGGAGVALRERTADVPVRS